MGHVVLNQSTNARTLFILTYPIENKSIRLTDALWWKYTGLQKKKHCNESIMLTQSRVFCLFARQKLAQKLCPNTIELNGV